MKKLTIAAAAAALAMSVVGCAPASSDGPTGEQTAAGNAFPASGEVVTIIVPYDAGGITDVFARLFAPELEAALGTTVRVENKPGAGGQIGLTALVGSDPDGYTIGFTNLPSTLAYLDPNRQATYDRESFTPLAGVALSPTVIAVAADSDYASLGDLVDAAQAAPGNVTLGSGGSGASDDYLASVELERASGADFNIVTFEGGSSDKVTALLGGNVEAIMGSAGGFLPQVANGDIRILGSATAEPSALLDGVPTFSDAGFDVVVSGTLNISGPAGIPDDVVTALTTAASSTTSSAEFVELMATSGFEPDYRTPAELSEQWTELESVVADVLGNR